MRKLCLSLISIVMAIALAGCTINPPANQEELCNKLKREAIYNSVNPNMQATWTTTAQKDALKQQLKANNCQ